MSTNAMNSCQRRRTWATTCLIFASFLLSSCRGWILQPSPAHKNHRHLLYSSVASSHNLGTDETAWKKEGERIILQAAVEAGAKPEMIQIDWKSGKIVVTVDGSAYIPAELEEIVFDDDDDLVLDDDDDDDEGEVDWGEEEFDEQEFNPLEEEAQEVSLGVDVVAIAKAVNAAFDAEGEGTIGYNIAVHHSIEVTTPGAADELSGVMFEAYRGFDVILEFLDPKTGKTKKVEGKLVEKDNEFTRINERGRMRKFKNEVVQSVKLPKAKTEKGNSGKKSQPKSKRKKRK